MPKSFWAQAKSKILLSIRTNPRQKRFLRSRYSISWTPPTRSTSSWKTQQCPNWTAFLIGEKQTKQNTRNTIASLPMRADSSDTVNQSAKILQHIARQLGELRTLALGQRHMRRNRLLFEAIHQVDKPVIGRVHVGVINLEAIAGEN